MKIRCFAVAMLNLMLLFSVSHAQEGQLKIDSPVPFRGIARLHTLASKDKNFSARSVYPTFVARTPLVRFVNAQIGSEKRRAYTAWLKDARGQLKEFQTPAPFELQSVPSLTYFSPSRLISLRFDSYEYMGGAHGMAVMETRNFGIVKGRPKALSLGDFFAPGTNYRRLVETKIFAKLKKDENAQWVRDGSVKTLNNAQFNNFSIGRDGLTWLFNQYEMGPYVVGQFEVKLLRRELGPGFLGMK